MEHIATRQLRSTELNQNSIAMLTVESGNSFNGSGNFDFDGQSIFALHFSWNDGGFTGQGWFLGDKLGPLANQDVAPENSEEVSDFIEAWVQVANGDTITDFIDNHDLFGSCARIGKNSNT